VKILITGANGFVGRHLCQALLAQGQHQIIRAVRQSQHAIEGTTTYVCGTINAETQWGTILEGVDVVIHLAGRVHVMHDDPSTSLPHYREANTASTVNLARQAIQSGVKRFIFMSTIKVCGEGQTTVSAPPYREQITHIPTDPYALSKWEAEQALMGLAKEYPLEVTIIRPPLIYGAGVKANFLRLIAAIHQGLPLPLGCIHNLRHLIYVGNLNDAIITCASHPAAANKTYLVSDGIGFSTPALIKGIAKHLGRRARLLPIPVWVLDCAAFVLRKQAAISRLKTSMKIDDQAIRNELQWKAPYSPDEGLAHTVDWYRKQLVIQKND
jgi:nucleoside-diphosphate-sugar epimerase